jgi:hypothetical protein
MQGGETRQEDELTEEQISSWNAKGSICWGGRRKRKESDVVWRRRE